MYIIRGHITEHNVPVIREVALYDRDSGSLLNTTLSNISGEYAFQIPESRKDQYHYVVAFDTEEGPFNAQVKDYIKPEEV